jgi:hypothetical protein
MKQGVSFRELGVDAAQVAANLGGFQDMADIRVEMIDVEGQLAREIADPRMTREDVALTYAFALRQWNPADTRYAAINRAIMERWSLSALKWIKTRAWALYEGRA